MAQQDMDWVQDPPSFEQKLTKLREYVDSFQTLRRSMEEEVKKTSFTKEQYEVYQGFMTKINALHEKSDPAGKLLEDILAELQEMISDETIDITTANVRKILEKKHDIPLGTVHELYACILRYDHDLENVRSLYPESKRLLFNYELSNLQKENERLQQLVDNPNPPVANGEIEELSQQLAEEKSKREALEKTLGEQDHVASGTQIAQEESAKLKERCKTLEASLTKVQKDFDTSSKTEKTASRRLSVVSKENFRLRKELEKTVSTAESEKEQATTNANVLQKLLEEHSTLQSEVDEKITKSGAELKKYKRFVRTTATNNLSSCLAASLPNSGWHPSDCISFVRMILDSDKQSWFYGNQDHVDLFKYDDEYKGTNWILNASVSRSNPMEPFVTLQHLKPITLALELMECIDVRATERGSASYAADLIFNLISKLRTPVGRDLWALRVIHSIPYFFKDMFKSYKPENNHELDLISMGLLMFFADFMARHPALSHDREFQETVDWMTSSTLDSLPTTLKNVMTILLESMKSNKSDKVTRESLQQKLGKVMIHYPEQNLSFLPIKGLRIEGYWNAVFTWGQGESPMSSITLLNSNMFEWNEILEGDGMFWEYSITNAPRFAGIVFRHDSTDRVSNWWEEFVLPGAKKGEVMRRADELVAWMENGGSPVDYYDLMNMEE